MICRAVIMKYVRSLPPGTLFTTRDLLSKGFKRNTIDKAFSRLVAIGALIRKVRGLFVDAYTAKSEYSDDEIAALKASSFGKEIRQHTADAAKEIGLPVENNEHVTYQVNGATSKFLLRPSCKPIFFKTACAKKMRMNDNELGKLVRGLWHLGRKKLTPKLFMVATQALKRDQCKQLLLAGAWMPHWLMDRFVEKYSGRFKPSEPPQNDLKILPLHVVP